MYALFINALMLQKILFMIDPLLLVDRTIRLVSVRCVFSVSWFGSAENATI